MAKKQKTEKVEIPVVETPVVETPKPKKVEPKKPKWEIKDRVYNLRGNKKPLSRMIRSANIYWFDEEKGYERELKYCQNQKLHYKNYYLFIIQIKTQFTQSIILLKKLLTTLKC